MSRLLWIWMSIAIGISPQGIWYEIETTGYVYEVTRPVLRECLAFSDGYDCPEVTRTVEIIDGPHCVYIDGRRGDVVEFCESQLELFRP